MNMLQYKL